ncbi:MAG: M14 family zinc carboxypeptidase [Bacteroidota bacterium]
MKSLSTLFFTILCTLSIFAQIQHPDDFFPEKLGEHFYPHHLIVDYFQHIADNSDQVQLVEYGRTNQNRPLILAYISSAENIKNLEAIRTNNLKRTGLIEGEATADNKAIVWLSFAVHGNEASCPIAAVKTIYELVGGENKSAKGWLDNTVVIIDPTLNPDGYSRYTHWNRNVSHKILNTNPISREHQEPWPGGRVNHYLFDLNRDWAWATQKESQQRIPQYRKWMPHIHGDFHEQGYNSPYYFAPAAAPFHEYITDFQKTFQTEIGQHNAKFFDEQGWLYFTKERFDLLYPSYGDTYPTFNGSIGMTYEQAGNSRAGIGIDMENGDTSKLIDRIEHHAAAALATIEMSANNVERLVKNFSDYFNNSTKKPEGKYTTFVISGANPLDKIKRLTELLDIHQIQYGRSTKGQKIKAFDYVSGKTTDIQLSDNDLVISAYQPMSVLTQVLFEPETFVEDSITYDITAWSLPYAHGLKAYASTQKIQPDASFDFATPMPQIVDDNPYSYIFKWESLDDAALLGGLLKKGVKVRCATNPFTMNGVKYPSGTLLVNRADNKHLQSGYNETVQATAYEYQRKLTTVTTGFSQNGADFGSGQMRLIDAPKVLVVYSDATRTNSYGQVWHYFEQTIQYPFTAVTTSQLGRIPLSDFNTIILTDGRYAGMDETLGDWIKGGGKLIAMGSAVRSFAGKKGFKIKSKTADSKKADSLAAKVKKYADQERDFIKGFIPGAIFKLKVDNTHPLAYGLPDYYFTLKTTNRNYEVSEDLWNVGYIDKQPFSVGFVGSKARKNVEESVVLATQSLGRGDVIYLVDNPLYRAFWEQGTFVMSNALFLVD